MHVQEQERGEEVAVAAMDAQYQAGGLEQAMWFFQILRELVPGGILKKVEEVVMLNLPYVPKTEFEKFHYSRGVTDGETKGKAEEAAQSVLNILEARGLAVSGEEQERILASQDLGQLRQWLIKALSVGRTQDLFVP